MIFSVPKKEDIIKWLAILYIGSYVVWIVATMLFGTKFAFGIFLLIAGVMGLITVCTLMTDLGERILPPIGVMLSSSALNVLIFSSHIEEKAAGMMALIALCAIGPAYMMWKSAAEKKYGS
jgi:hypothetical protein